MPIITVFLLALTVRISISVLTRTFFQPDEFFQCLEPAHRLAFDYGQLTWEWAAEKPIRSIAYPALWAGVYRVLHLTVTDGTELLILAPKVLSGLLAAFLDAYLYILTQKVLGQPYANAALFLSLTSFFHSLALTRTLATSLEAVLTTIALSYWPFHDRVSDSNNIRKALAVAALSCILRPTSAILWAFLAAELLLTRRAGHWFIVDSAVIGGVALIVGSLIDTYSFETKTSFSLSLTNFILVNSSRVSQFYGTMPWHYYLTQALPLLCTTALPFFLIGCKNAFLRPPEVATRRMVMTIAWTVSIYSAISHKEWRFLHSLLPLMHIIAAKGMVDLSRDHKDVIKSLGIRKLFAIVAVLTIPLSVYTMRYHGYAQVAVMHYLRSLPAEEVKSVGFLMPCHSTPMQSYLHRSQLEQPGLLWAIGCEPPLSERNDDMGKEYRDQSDVFYDSPSTYLNTYFPTNLDPSFPPSSVPVTPPGTAAHFPSDLNPVSRYMWNHTWPSHLVFFGVLLGEDGVKSVLEAKGYRRAWRTWNGFEEDPRRRGGVQVWKWVGTAV